MTDEIKVGTLVEWESNPNYVGIVMGVGETCYLISPFNRGAQKPVQPEQAWLKKYCKRTASYKPVVQEEIKIEGIILKGKIINCNITYDPIWNTTKIELCYQ